MGLETANSVKEDGKVVWKATWKFGGENVISERRESETAVFSSKEAAYRWLRDELVRWYDFQDGESFFDCRLQTVDTQTGLALSARDTLARFKADEQGDGDFKFTWKVHPKLVKK